MSKVFSRGIWAATATIARLRADLDNERSSEGFAKKKEADARRREKDQAGYVMAGRETSIHKWGRILRYSSHEVTARSR
jgi:hypothetical protein